MPPVDADAFEFLYTLAMETSRSSNPVALDDLFFRPMNRYPGDSSKSDDFFLRFDACMRFMGSGALAKFPEDRIGPLQMAAVRLAASYPLIRGEFFDGAFLETLAKP